MCIIQTVIPVMFLGEGMKKIGYFIFGFLAFALSGQLLHANPLSDKLKKEFKLGSLAISEQSKKALENFLSFLDSTDSESFMNGDILDDSLRGLREAFQGAGDADKFPFTNRDRLEVIILKANLEAEKEKRAQKRKDEENKKNVDDKKGSNQKKELIQIDGTQESDDEENSPRLKNKKEKGQEKKKQNRVPLSVRVMKDFGISEEVVALFPEHSWDAVYRFFAMLDREDPAHLIEETDQVIVERKELKDALAEVLRVLKADGVEDKLPLFGRGVLAKVIKEYSEDLGVGKANANPVLEQDTQLEKKKVLVKKNEEKKRKSDSDSDSDNERENDNQNQSKHLIRVSKNDKKQDGQKKKQSVRLGQSAEFRGDFEQFFRRFTEEGRWFDAMEKRFSKDGSSWSEFVESVFSKTLLEEERIFDLMDVLATKDREIANDAIADSLLTKIEGEFLRMAHEQYLDYKENQKKLFMEQLKGKKSEELAALLQKLEENKKKLTAEQLKRKKSEELAAIMQKLEKSKKEEEKIRRQREQDVKIEETNFSDDRTNGGGARQIVQMEEGSLAEVFKALPSVEGSAIWGVRAICDAEGGGGLFGREKQKDIFDALSSYVENAKKCSSDKSSPFFIDISNGYQEFISLVRKEWKAQEIPTAKEEQRRRLTSLVQELLNEERSTGIHHFVPEGCLDELARVIANDKIRDSAERAFFESLSMYFQKNVLKEVRGDLPKVGKAFLNLIQRDLEKEEGDDDDTSLVLKKKEGGDPKQIENITQKKKRQDDDEEEKRNN